MSSSVDLSKMTGNFSRRVTEAWMLLGFENTGLETKNGSAYNSQKLNQKLNNSYEKRNTDKYKTNFEQA